MPYTYDELLPLIEARGGRIEGRPGGQIKFLCPVHSESDPSATLHPKFGLKCWSAHCDAFEMAAALGWVERTNGHSHDRVPKTRARAPVQASDDESGGGSNRRPPPVWVLQLPDREFIYTDAKGNPVAIHGRWNLGPDNKTFAWRLPGTPSEASWDSGYRGGLGRLSEDNIPLFNLHDLLHAEEGSDVWIVEGEKAVEAATVAGLLATTLAGGSGQRKFGKGVLDPLKRLRRIFWPDHDAVGWAFMNSLAQRTQDFPHGQHMLRVPDPEPKDDAYDWFVRRKGSISDLKIALAGIHTVPTSEYLGDDALRIFLPTVSGNMVTIDALSIEKTPRRELNAELSINLDGPAHAVYPYQIRSNLLSSSSRTQLARDLKDFFVDSGIKDWPQVLNTSTVLVQKGFLARARGRDMADLPRAVTDRSHLKPMFPWKRHTVVFGQGSGLKSVTVQSMAMCMALGYPWADGFDNLIPGPWGWLDYEDNDDGETFRRRAERVCRGLFIDELPRNLIHFYAGEGIPFVDLLPDLKAYTLEHGLIGWVVDSAMPACGGDPNNVQSVQQYFDAASKLHTSMVTLAHVTKAAATASSKAEQEAQNLMPFGAASWNLRARMTWNVQASQAEESSIASVKWFNRKSNGRRSKPFGFRTDFNDPDGPIVFRHDDAVLSERIAEAEDTSGADEVATVLTRHIAPMSISEISLAAGISDKQVRRILAADRERFTETRKGTRGAPSLYSTVTPATDAGQPDELVAGLPWG